jgi:hypothetical protein
MQHRRDPSKISGLKWSEKAGALHPFLARVAAAVLGSGALRRAPQPYFARSRTLRYTPFRYTGRAKRQM